MPTQELTTAIYDRLESRGHKGKIVSVRHVNDLRERLRGQYQQGLLDEKFHTEWLQHFDYGVSKEVADTGSLIIVATPQPQVRIGFNVNGIPHTCTVPATYSHATDKPVERLLEDVLQPEGYQVIRAVLPMKLLAVRSGLARYGTNNITYVEGMGSFHRLTAFVSDLPCHQDHWGELKTHKRCDECTLCQKACPTDAIGTDRFLLHAERCLTYFNEGKEDFPRWLDPYWHNCLVGCLYCQKVCPIDREFKDRITEGATFSRAETAAILEGVPKEALPPEAVQKLEALDLTEYLEVLGRNLRVLMDKVA